MTGLRLALLLIFVFASHGCTAPARPVSSNVLESWLPFIEDRVTTRQELRQRLGTPDWEEMNERVAGYRMSGSSGRGDLQRGWRHDKPNHFDLIVAFDAEHTVRAHSLVLKSRNRESARLSRSDVESLSATAGLDDVLLKFGRSRRQSSHWRTDDIVVYGWGRTQGEEYEYGAGNTAGGYLVLQIDQQRYEIRRRYIVDRQRWEDNLNEGVAQTIKYWRFLDRADER